MSKTTQNSRFNTHDVGGIADTTKKKSDVVLTATTDRGTVNVTVKAKQDESADSLLRRFNREVMRAGVMRRLKELEFYEKPSTRKKREKKIRVKRIKDYERWAE